MTPMLEEGGTFAPVFRESLAAVPVLGRGGAAAPSGLDDKHGSIDDSQALTANGIFPLWL